MRARAASGKPLLLLVAALAGLVAHAVGFNRQYPISEWLLVRVLEYWALALYWGASCLGAGLLLVSRVAPRQYRPSEAAFVAFPLGVLTFGITTFVAALIGRLNTVYFYCAPGVLLAIAWSDLVRWVRRVRAAGVLPRAWTHWDVLAAVLGVTGLVLVYVPILTPHNLQHDARWYHLPIAAQYAALRALPRFPEGWFLGAYPHLSSLLYAWAMLWPRGIVDRLELCAHLEFVVFLVTVASIPAVLRRLVPGARLPASWAAFFLFPGFLVYDANVSGGADHIAAVWAPGGLLALLAVLRTLSPRHAAIVGAMAAGALLTKYSAGAIALPLLGALFVRAVLLVARRRHVRRATAAMGTALGAFVVLWSPHWLKNWLFYGDPLYPILNAYLPVHPWNLQAAMYFRLFIEGAVLQPSRDLHGVLESVRAALTIGFDVHEYDYHRELPTFGFLFAATLYCLPFVAAGWRIWVTEAVSVTAAIVWFWSNHRDRYLQNFLPWLVAGTTAVLVRAFRYHGRAGRLAVILLVVSELAFGAGVYLLPVHVMTPGGHPIPHVGKLVLAGMKGDYGRRYEPYPEWGFADWTVIGQTLPLGARVLVHEDRLWIGLDAPVVVDEAAWQGGIRYSACASAAEVYDLLRGYGVTHVVTGDHHGDGGDHGLMGSLVFWDFLSGSARKVVQRGKLTLWSMPKERPLPVPPGPALILTCDQSEPPGLYDYPRIIERAPLVEAAGDDVPGSLFERAAFYVVEADCGYPLEHPGFEVMGTRGRVSFLRKAPR